MESNKLHYSADELVGHRVLEIRHISVQGTTIDHLRHFFVLEKGISFEIAECNPWETELKIPTFDDVHFKTSGLTSSSLPVFRHLVGSRFGERILPQFQGWNDAKIVCSSLIE